MQRLIDNRSDKKTTNVKIKRYRPNLKGKIHTFRFKAALKPITTNLLTPMQPSPKNKVLSRKTDTQERPFSMVFRERRSHARYV